MIYPVSIHQIGTFKTEHPQRDALALENARRTAQLIEDFGSFAFNRANDIAHITASAFVLSPDRRHVLLMHHAKLDRWLQPGGHCDSCTDVRRAAEREAQEETGLTSLRLISNDIFDIDIHEIPARGKEPTHLHYDVRFLFEADPSLPLQQNSESKQLAWMTVEEMHRATDASSVTIIEREMTR